MNDELFETQMKAWPDTAMRAGIAMSMTRLTPTAHFVVSLEGREVSIDIEKSEFESSTGSLEDLGAVVEHWGPSAVLNGLTKLLFDSAAVGSLLYFLGGDFFGFSNEPPSFWREGSMRLNL